jgi:hypothetical protein
MLGIGTLVSELAVFRAIRHGDVDGLDFADQLGAIFSLATLLLFDVADAAI